MGHKDTQGKQHVEYSWEFLKAQMARMGKNKDKYERDNWKKPINIEELKYALFRHTLEVMNGEYKDGTELGHLEAIAINAGIIWHQLKQQ